MADTCTKCNYKGFPETYSPARQTIGIVVIVAIAALSVGGLLLSLYRRHTRLMSIRPRWIVFSIVTNCLVTITIPLHDVLGEALYPCVLAGASSGLLISMFPIVLILRVAIIYSRHARQREAVHVTRAASAAFLDRFVLFVDRAILFCRFERTFAQVVFSLCSFVPGTIVISILLVENPAYGDLSAVGCRTPNVLGVFVVPYIFVVLAALAPFYVSIVRSPSDSLFLRREIMTELVVSPFIAAFCIYVRYSTALQHDDFSGYYGICFCATLCLIVAVWVPALLSFSSFERRCELGPAEAGREIEMAASPTFLQGDSLNKSEKGQDAARRQFNVSRASKNVDVVEALHPGHVEISRGLLARGSGPQPFGVVSQEIIAFLESGRASVVPNFRAPSPLLKFKEIISLPGDAIASNPTMSQAVAAALIATPSGQPLMWSTCRSDMCAELLAFVIQCGSLQKLVDTVIASGRRATTLAPRRLSTASSHRTDYPRSEVPSAEVHAFVAVCVEERNNREPRQGYNSPVFDDGKESDDYVLELTALCTGVKGLLRQFVEPGATMQVCFV